MNVRSLVAAGLAVSGLFFAAPKADASVHGRFKHQRQRIMRGYRNGTLTRPEFDRLMADQRALHARGAAEGRHGFNKRERRDMN